MHETTRTLAARTPFRGEDVLSFLAGDAATGIEEIVGRTYRRTALLPHGPAILSATPNSRGVEAMLEVSAPEDIEEGFERIRKIFDLDADPDVDDALATDPLLAPLVSARPGLRVPGHDDPFELMVRTILGQQVSVTAARTQAGRLVAAYGERLPAPSGSLTHLFPTPEALQRIPEGALRMPRVRARAVVHLAEAVAERRVSFDPGREELDRELLAVPGIGPWTVAYTRLRGLSDPDVFLEGDLVARQGLSRLVGRELTPTEAKRRAEAWRPYRSYALMHTWYSLGIFEPS